MSMENPSGNYLKAKNVLDKYLQENKMKKTQERYALLEAIYSFKKPFDIHEMQQKMEGAAFRTSLATIYNTFILFEKAHLLMRSKPDGRYSKFFANNNTSARQFLICSECGQVRTVSLTRLNNSVRNTKWPRFTAKTYTLYIGGICYNCQKKKEREAKKVKESKTL